MPSAIAASSFDSAAIIAIAPSSSPFASIARSASRGVGAAFFSATGSRASSAVTAAFPAVRWSASTAAGPSGAPAGGAGSRSGAVSALPRGRSGRSFHRADSLRFAAGRFGAPGTVQGDVSLMHRSDLRASDLDRERAVEFLKAHYAAGRLQHDELARRSDAAYRAVAISELDWLTSDLPALARPAPRRRRFSPLKAAVLFALFMALLVILPPEGGWCCSRSRRARLRRVLPDRADRDPGAPHRGRRVPDRARDAAAAAAARRLALASAQPQRRRPAAVVGGPQAARGPVGRVGADDARAQDLEAALGEDVVDTVVERPGRRVLDRRLPEAAVVARARLVAQRARCRAGRRP